MREFSFMGELSFYSTANNAKLIMLETAALSDCIYMEDMCIK